MNFATIQNRIVNFLQDESGVVAVEYAVMLALIVVVCLATITTLGNNVNANFNSAATALTPGP